MKSIEDRFIFWVISLVKNQIKKFKMYDYKNAFILELYRNDVKITTSECITIWNIARDEYGNKLLDNSPEATANYALWKWRGSPNRRSRG